MEEIPAHRRAVAPRSGDTIVIGADGEASNVDQAEREAAVRPEDPLDHDRNGRAGGDTSDDVVVAQANGFTLTDLGGGYYTVAGPGLADPEKIRGKATAEARFAALSAPAG